MKKKDVPQDPSVLDNFTKEVSYAVDENGKYTTELSRGWEVKASALSVSWENIKERVESARQQVLSGQASPILFFLELRIMDIQTLAAYTGYWQWTIKRHMKPRVFEKLSQKRLEKYAEVFEVELDDIRNFKSRPEKIEALTTELKQSIK